MATTILNWTLGVRISGGPNLSMGGQINVDAYDKIAVSIPDGATDYDVEIQPGEASNLMFLMIRSSKYENMTYKVNNTGDSITLDNLHLYMGAGAAELLQQSQPTFLSFTNGNSEAVNVEILVGRKATP